jgi:hypothetical protein
VLLGALLALVVDPPEPAGAQRQRGQHRRGQRDRQLAAPTFLRGLDARLAGLELGLVRALLGGGQVGVHGLRHFVGVRRPRRARRRQAVEAQPHERRVRAAGLDARVRRVELRARGLHDRRLALDVDVRRLAGEQLA